MMKRSYLIICRFSNNSFVRENVFKTFLIHFWNADKLHSALTGFRNRQKCFLKIKAKHNYENAAIFLYYYSFILKKTYSNVP